jgi:hypothetical protein
MDGTSGPRPNEFIPRAKALLRSLDGRWTRGPRDAPQAAMSSRRTGNDAPVCVSQ